MSQEEKTYGTEKHPLAYFAGMSREEMLTVPGVGEKTADEIEAAQAAVVSAEPDAPEAQGVTDPLAFAADNDGYKMLSKSVPVAVSVQNGHQVWTAQGPNPQESRRMIGLLVSLRDTPRRTSGVYLPVVPEDRNHAAVEVVE